MSGGDGQAGGRACSDQPLVVSTISARFSLARILAVSVARLMWRRRAEAWDREGSVRVSRVVDAVLAECGELAGAVAVDVGCGAGQTTFRVAARCRHVLALDISPQAIAMLTARAARDDVVNIQAVVLPAETLELSPESLDLVVSNYAMHHLRDADKRRLVERSFVWLRPGGRLVIGDMMFGRGGDPVDRAIIREKVRTLIGRGPGGWWRILKNGLRFLLRFQEKPLRPAAWEAIVREAGFANVRAFRVVAEAGVVSARKPPAPIEACTRALARALPATGATTLRPKDSPGGTHSVRIA